MRKIIATSLLVLLCACGSQSFSGDYISADKNTKVNFDGKGYAKIEDVSFGTKTVIQMKYKRDGNKLVFDAGSAQYIADIKSDGSIDLSMLFLGTVKPVK